VEKGSVSLPGPRIVPYSNQTTNEEQTMPKKASKKAAKKVAKKAAKKKK
jgi:hypothetical protein